jgi:hypothetical protein
VIDQKVEGDAEEWWSMDPIRRVNSPLTRKTGIKTSISTAFATELVSHTV